MGEKERRRGEKLKQCNIYIERVLIDLSNKLHSVQ